MTIKTVDSKTLKKWLEKGEAVLIDVREPSEHAHCHIKGSILMPPAEVNAKALAKFRNKKLVFHCKIGQRSAIACEKVAKEDPKLNVYNLDGGIDSWKGCGFRCVMGQGACGMSSCYKFGSLCIEDQIRVVLGSVILLFIILGYYVNDAFFWITGALGVLFIISGFTGKCMLRDCLKGLACNKGKDGGTCDTTPCDMPKIAMLKKAAPAKQAAPAKKKAVSKPVKAAVAKVSMAKAKKPTPKKSKSKGKSKKKK